MPFAPSIIVTLSSFIPVVLSDNGGFPELCLVLVFRMSGTCIWYGTGTASIDTRGVSV